MGVAEVGEVVTAPTVAFARGPTTEEALREVLANPTTTVEVTSRVLSVSKWAFYEAVKRGEPPVPIIRVGRRIVVPTAPLRVALGMNDTGSQGGREGEPLADDPFRTRSEGPISPVPAAGTWKSGKW
jgi:hypothetical protein